MKNRIRLVPAILLLAGILIFCPAFSFAQSRTIRLNETTFAYAEELIAQGRVVIDKKNAWRHHHPMAEEENEFIRAHGFAEYGKWHLGIDERFGYADIEKAATQLIEIINSKKENRPGAKHRLPVSAPSGVNLR